MLRPGTTLALVLLLPLVACGTSADEDAASERRKAEAMGPTSAPKYRQTWPKEYDYTSCAEWTGSMTEEQRSAGAADMLTVARNRGDGGTGLPPDALIDAFNAGVTSSCNIPQAAVSEVGAGLYLLERERFRP